MHEGGCGLGDRRDQPDPLIKGEPLYCWPPAAAAGLEGTLCPVAVEPGLNVEAKARDEGSERLK